MHTKYLPIVYAEAYIDKFHNEPALAKIQAEKEKEEKKGACRQALDA